MKKCQLFSSKLSSLCFSSIVGMKHLLGCFPSVVWHLSGASHFHFLSQKINFPSRFYVKIDRLTVSSPAETPKIIVDDVHRHAEVVKYLSTII